jgi:hypothetical protein
MNTYENTEIPEHLRETLHNAAVAIQIQKNEAIEKYLRDNLASIGHTFDTREQFCDFMRSRVTRVKDHPTKMRFSYYIDYNIETQGGILIGVTLESMQNPFYSVTTT